MPTRPRLLFMVQLPPPVHGAANMNRLAVESAHLREMFDIRVLPLRFAASIGDIGRFRPAKLGAMAAVFFRLLMLLVLFRPKAVYLTLSPTGGAFLRDALFVALLRLFGTARILHLRGKGIAGARTRPWLDRFYRFVFSGAHVILLARSLAQDVTDLVPPSALSVVHNGIADPCPGGPPGVAGPGLPRSGCGSAPRVLFLSNMIVEKGPLVLVEALAGLKRQGFDFRADFVGAWQSDDVRRRFDDAVQAGGLRDHVVVHGPLYGADKGRLLRSADIMAFPTFYGPECFPGVLLEAMAHGLPVVTTMEGGIPEIVEDGVTGFLVPQRDPDSLKERLADLLRDPDRGIRMGQAGRAAFEQRFQLHHFEAALEGALRAGLGIGSGVEKG
ncbi:MAG: hypothetical protein RLY86_641 [Pseudomonadota bacterium]